MAPEQAVGNSAAISNATDVYGIGAVLYQLLTGHPPFAGGTTYETIKLLLDTEPRQPRLWNSKIDCDLSTICLKCIDKNPKRRYPSALSLAEDLERWLKYEPICLTRLSHVTHHFSMPIVNSPLLMTPFSLSLIIHPPAWPLPRLPSTRRLGFVPMRVKRTLRVR